MRKDTFGIYIHIPFCVRKCAYCDFLSAPPASAEAMHEYVEALCREIILKSKVCATKRNKATIVDTVFFGGGTPSLLVSEDFNRILGTLRECFTIAEDAEITVECNPDTVDYNKFKNYFEQGVNRISFGLQSACNEELKMLGRIHSYERFLESFADARKAGFTNINVDLMSALPGQTLESWTDTLKKVAELDPEHISAYSLIIEEGTPFYARYGESEGKEPLLCGRPGLTAPGATVDEDGTIEAKADAADLMADWPDLPDEDTERAMYDATAEILSGYGYDRYEISNYAKKNKECVHNVGYWTGIDYIGLGLGASSMFDGARFTNLRDIEIYKEAGKKTQLPTDWETVRQLTDERKIEEFMFLGLRMMRGVSRKEFERRFKKSMDEVYAEVIAKYIGLGLLTEADGWVRLTKKGIDVSNQVLADFLLDVEDQEEEILLSEFDLEVQEELERVLAEAEMEENE